MLFIYYTFYSGVAYKYENNAIFILKSREPLKLPKNGDI